MVEAAPGDIAARMAETRARWDARARIHAADRSGFYRVQAFLDGETELEAASAGDLGPLEDKRVAHLQCHFGLDTLRLKRLGAAEIAGLDYSAEAIRQARALAAKSGLEATFHEADVYDAPAVLGEGRWDLVYVTWGAINWLPDIGRWAAVCAALLAPGGRLFLRDGHPFCQMLDVVEGELKLCYDWRTPRAAPLRFEEAQSYSGDEDPLPEGGDHEWIHAMSDIVGGVLEAGLTLERLEEHEWLVWDMYPGLTVKGEDGLYRLPEGLPRIPQSFTLVARKG
ncbi:MAG: class I SAM-dependent methyltransferase [Pseudomonadota bacterium]